ncbi:MOS1T transposase, partial [Pseudoatta argentina]
MEGAGVEPKEEGVGILLREKEGEGIVPREEEGISWIAGSITGGKQILQVDESTVSKGLGMIQKQGHWVPYELKPRDVERRFGTCELLLQRQKRKGFLTITGDRYRLQLRRLSRALKEKRPLYAQRYDKVILLHDNARPHVAKPVKTYLETLKWEVLPHPLYSPDIAPSDFHLFPSMAHGLADRRFHFYEEAQKWIASKDMSFFRRGIHVLPER